MFGAELVPEEYTECTGFVVPLPIEHDSIRLFEFPSVPVVVPKTTVPIVVVVLTPKMVQFLMILNVASFCKTKAELEVAVFSMRILLLEPVPPDRPSIL